MCDVLVVDDDWNYGSPNNGGLPYYTSTLDALGIGYDVWDTESPYGDSPAFSDMVGYDVVIWFTGNAFWWGVFTPADEAAVAQYLDAGGQFVLSSQDYFDEADYTDFMANYLGVEDIVWNVTITSIAGVAGHPIGEGLGPYTLVSPDDWDVYWPPPGPYDDEVTARPGASSPFRYDDPENTETNSTSYEGLAMSAEPHSEGNAAGRSPGTEQEPVFRTVFLAWPFEWVDTLEQRSEILGAILAWMECLPQMNLNPPHSIGSGPPGSGVPYTLTLANDLGWTESFDVAYESAWETEGPATIGPVPDAGDLSFVVTVTVPMDAACYETGQATVTATAQSDPAFVDYALLETGAEPAGLGDLDGVVSDANTDLGIADAQVRLQLSEYVYQTYTNEDGSYALSDLPACVYDGQYSAMGYSLAYATLPIPNGTTLTVDMELDAPLPILSHDAVSVSVPHGGTETFDLLLTNSGSADLTFQITEMPGSMQWSLAADDPSRLGPPLMPAGVDPYVYADLEASPDGLARFIVYMADQGDLSEAFGIRDRSARGYHVLNALRSTADQTQADLRAELDRAGIAYESRYIVNCLTVKGDANLVDALARRPDVGFIGSDGAVPPAGALEAQQTAGGTDPAEYISWGITKTQAISAWQEYDAMGQGIVVASIDTGVRYNHEALAEQYRGQLGGSAYDHNRNWWDPYGLDPDEPYDGHGQGTATMGAILGNDKPNDPTAGDHILGMAPKSTWFTCQGFSDRGSGPGASAELLECAEFVLAPWDLQGENPDPDQRADIVNSSWVGGQAQWWYSQAIYAWRAAGILPVFSAGNGPPNCETVVSPGDLGSVLAVGATDQLDNIITRSSRGPALVTDLLKPDVSAPGQSILAALADGTYGYVHGSVIAAPHVAGETALIWSAVPEAQGEVELTYGLIEQSAFPITTTQECGGIPGDQIPNNVAGWGRIDAHQAVSLALSADWDIPWLVVQPMNGLVEPGENQEIELLFDTSGLSWGEQYTARLGFRFNDPYRIRAVLPITLSVECMEATSLAISGPTELPAGEIGLYSATWLPITATVPVNIVWSNGATGAVAEYSWSELGLYTILVSATVCTRPEPLTASFDVIVTEPNYAIYLPLVLRDR